MMSFDKKIVASSAILAAAAIGLGAFGAHGLRDVIGVKGLASFETGVRYQMYHSLALLIIGFAVSIPSSTRKWVYRLFLFGTILFSGSLYLLSLKDIVTFNLALLGPITPIGGLLLIVGWIRLLYGILKVKKL
ncbi:MAG: uncharacterized membrane protein YgdD (TMEM256/DUF423 family) [Sediminicola sp.]|jgi:uncharacterized membrane protein YgdD (TMEM256/DUF423 family)|tara:strand:- start:8760 stop:9158 length:399 start_codon:yes stop_codon:yes gene_type:complete